MQLLRRNPVFAHGTLSALQGLLDNATPVHYPVSSLLFREGEPAAYGLVIASGEVIVFSSARSGAEQIHDLVGQGELVGGAALLTDDRRTAGARAASATTAWLIDREVFLVFLEVTPTAVVALLRQVAGLLAAREAALDDLLSLDIKGRLAKTLLVLAERYGKPASQGEVHIGRRLTHRDLANIIGASRENVSRALAAFRAQGLVNYSFDSVRVLQPELLRRLI
jgi:CRP/FNR family transcriptional regulator